jgi:hypothetical protein
MIAGHESEVPSPLMAKALHPVAISEHNDSLDRCGYTRLRFSKPPQTRAALNGKIGVTQELGIGERALMFLR